jgi:hypothetical protein
MRAATATVEQKARNLQTKVADNADVMDRLRQERSMLLNDHKDLQLQYADVNEVSRMMSRSELCRPELPHFPAYECTPRSTSYCTEVPR